MTRIVRRLDSGVAFWIRAGRDAVSFSAIDGESGAQIHVLIRPAGAKSLAVAIYRAGSAAGVRSAAVELPTPDGMLRAVARGNPGYISLALGCGRDTLSLRLDAATAIAAYGELMEAAAIARSRAGEGPA